MTAIARRIAAGITLAAAPLVILAGAGSAQAQTTPAHNGPTATHHSAFPHQHNTPKPGSREHHHHQRNHAG